MYNFFFELKNFVDICALFNPLVIVRSCIELEIFLNFVLIIGGLFFTPKKIFFYSLMFWHV